MSDQTNEHRVGMARDLAGERERAAHDLAVEEGRRRERVDGRLQGAEARLDAVNGSIRDHAASVKQLSGKVDELVQEQRTRNALEAERAKALKKANEGQISKRNFALGVVAVALPTLVDILVQTRAFQ